MKGRGSKTPLSLKVWHRIFSTSSNQLFKKSEPLIILTSFTRANYWIHHCYPYIPTTHLPTLNVSNIRVAYMFRTVAAYSK